MSNPNKERLLELIRDIAPGSASAEYESDNYTAFLRNFLPVTSYHLVLGQDLILILGGRGVGKTELFRLLAIPAGRNALVANSKIKALPSLDKTTWISAFGRIKKHENTFPPQDIIAKTMQNANGIDWRAFWIGLMLGIILRQDDAVLNSSWIDPIPLATREVLINKLPLLSDWFPLVHQDMEKINHALDLLDEKLIATDQWLFVSYDELDRVVISYNDLAAPIRELLAFWLDRWRRWERIKPKIFLRTDLFREEFLGFADASKLKGHQINLEWKPAWLYQLLFKRLANSGEEMAEYLQTIASNLITKTDPELGIMVSDDESLYELLIEKIIGKFMGANARKGYTYRWVPNHLQDAGRRITPRSFLNLFSSAAERRLEQLNKQNLPENTLLHPSDLQAALVDTSQDRIRELADEEYPWLESLKTSLKDLNVPIEESIFLEALNKTQWNDQAGKLPFSTKPEDVLEILNYLIQLKVVERLSEDRINIPEIYLYGLGVKRKGGIKRPK